MKALLLAAGLGTRLRPLTETVPKCLVPIHGKPLLAYWLELLLPQDASTPIEEVLINTHYLPEQVVQFIETSVWRDRVTCLHEPELLGTAGTIHANRHRLSGGPFLVAHADNLTRFDIHDFAHAHHHRPSKAAITMMTFETDVPQQCGIVKCDDEGMVVGFYEKSSIFYGTRANAAVYILEPSVLSFLASLDRAFIDMSTEVIPAFMGQLYTYHNADYHRDIGTPSSLVCAEQEFL